jgi:hypothetical protein
MIEDAAYCIAQELADGPVALVHHDRPWRQGSTVHQSIERFASKSAAIARACNARDADELHDAFITAATSDHVLMDKIALKRECERRQQAAAALEAIARYVCEYSWSSVTDGPRMLAPVQAAQRKQRIEELGKALQQLALGARRGTATYSDFDAILGRLHKLGFFPETPLVSSVARAFTD